MIEVNICSRDRVTEASLLLQSLRTQTYQQFNVHVLDDASGTPMTNYHFFNCLCNRLRFEGHRVNLIRNPVSRGVARARQQLVEHTLEHSKGKYICRLDDDVVLQPDFLERMMRVIKQGYDLASGVTPLMNGPLVEREVKYVEPIVNRVVLDEDGRFLFNGDDCGYSYLTDGILPAHHFRSNALIKREVHEKIKYECNLASHSFREETFFSLRALLAGFKIGVDLNAVVYHFVTPSGGERSHNAADSKNNQMMLNEFVRENKDELREITRCDASYCVEKDTNLLFEVR
jgi:GT2 family glycosyltransferase